MLEREILAGLRARGVDGDFVRLGGYFASTLRNSAGAYSGSELTGNCRLSWYDLATAKLKPLGDVAQPEPTAFPYAGVHDFIHLVPGGRTYAYTYARDASELYLVQGIQ